MDPMNNLTLNNPLANYDIFSIICSYLSLKDKINLFLINKLFARFLEQHFENLLNKENLEKPSDKTNIQLIKYNYNRNLRVTRIQSLLVGGKQEFTYFNFFKCKCITRIESGGKYFIAFIDNKNKGYLAKVTDFFSLKYKPITYQIFNNVHRIFCNSQKVFIQYLDGTVVTITNTQSEDKIYQNLQHIDWTLRLPVQQMSVSKNYAVFILGKISNYQLRKHVFMQQMLDQKPNVQKQNVKIIVYSIQAYKYYVINYPYKQILSHVVGSNTVCFVNENKQLIHCVLTNLNQGQQQLTATVNSYFQDKVVVQVYCGLHYYFVLTRQQSILENWDTIKVIRWLRTEGLSDYINIFKIEKIDGKKLLTLGKRYMEDVLGITSFNLQQKILKSIQYHQQTSNVKQQLYGWGKNEAGQLATNMAYFVNKPIKIKLPQFTKNEKVNQILCGWQNTIIRTSQNRIFLTKPQVKKQTEQTILQDQGKKRRKKTENQDDISPKKKKNTGNTGRQRDQKPIQKTTQKYQQQSRWMQYKPPNSAFAMSTVKDIILFIQLAYKEQQSKKKLRPIKSIIDKILWDPNLQKQQFKVGCFDHKMGILDISIQQYLNSDVKEHKVIYFKKNGQFVWHKQNRIDIV